MSTSDADVLAGVGPRLRQLRSARGATLAALAAETGLTTSTLSRIETGRLHPTLGQLLPLARAHRLSLDDLVGAPATGDPRLHLRPVRRSGLAVVPLTRRPGGVQAYKVVFPPAGRETTRRRQHHPGRQWVTVLAGRLRFVLDREETVLTEGDAASFDTRTPHWLGSADDRPAEVLALFGPQGERPSFPPDLG